MGDVNVMRSGKNLASISQGRLDAPYRGRWVSDLSHIVFKKSATVNSCPTAEANIFPGGRMHMSHSPTNMTTHQEKAENINQNCPQWRIL